jgi:hypothetical protein
MPNGWSQLAGCVDFPLPQAKDDHADASIAIAMDPKRVQEDSGSKLTHQERV